MTQWIPIGDGFIEADVIRWKEGIYASKSRRQRRMVKIGERLVIAEVLGEADDDGWVYLLVRSCEVLKVWPGKLFEILRNGKEMKRKKSTLLRGKLERLLWSDESARAMVASRFIGNRKKQKRLSKDDSEKG